MNNYDFYDRFNEVIHFVSDLVIRQIQKRISEPEVKLNDRDFILTEFRPESSSCVDEIYPYIFKTSNNYTELLTELLGLNINILYELKNLEKFKIANESLNITFNFKLGNLRTLLESNMLTYNEEFKHTRRRIKINQVGSYTNINSFLSTIKDKKLFVNELRSFLISGQDFSTITYPRIKSIISLLFVSEVSRNYATLIINCCFFELFQEGKLGNNLFDYYPMSSKKVVDECRDLYNTYKPCLYHYENRNNTRYISLITNKLKINENNLILNYLQVYFNDFYKEILNGKLDIIKLGFIFGDLILSYYGIDIKDKLEEELAVRFKVHNNVSIDVNFQNSYIHELNILKNPIFKEESLSYLISNLPNFKSLKDTQDELKTNHSNYVLFKLRFKGLLKIFNLTK
jgi:hypothetical protein